MQLCIFRIFVYIGDIFRIFVAFGNARYIWSSFGHCGCLTSDQATNANQLSLTNPANPAEQICIPIPHKIRLLRNFLKPHKPGIIGLGPEIIFKIAFCFYCFTFIRRLRLCFQHGILFICLSLLAFKMVFCFFHLEYYLLHLWSDIESLCANDTFFLSSSVNATSRESTKIIFSKVTRN